MKNLSIAGKLYLSFSIVILLTIVMGGVSIWRLNSVSGTFIDLQKKYFKIADYGMESKILLLTARRHEKDFLARNDKKYVSLMDETLKDLQKMAEDIVVLSNNMGLKKFAAIGSNVVTAKDEYSRSFHKVATLISERGNKDVGIAGKLRSHGHDAEAKIKKLNDRILMIEYLTIRRHEKDMLLREDVNYLNKARDVLASIEKYSDGSMPDSDKEAVLRDFTNYISTFSLLADNISGIKKEYPVMRNAAHEVEALLKNLESEVMEIVRIKEAEVVSSKESTVVFLYMIGSLIVLLCLILSFVSVRSISGPLNAIIKGLNEGANQVSSAAEQVYTSSRILAEGASEQAASIEETSASMEEMSSMTNRNAENASNADKLMDATNDVVFKAEGSMQKLTGAMGEISRASEETSKIIKTIDEIAFQTNLLALNAAVEAARAGEAGAGFAVVADEVRNLAMRAAEAAKNTAQLIEGTVSKIEEGSKIVESTSLAFGNVSESSGKIATLVAEISEASKEQANGIAQVNITINEMDKVIQQNASSADTSANASEELRRQSMLLIEFMKDLIKMAYGKSGKDEKYLKSSKNQRRLMIADSQYDENSSDE